MAERRNFLPRNEFPRLLSELVSAGYRCVGPHVRDGAIVYEPITGVEDLPQGIHDRQAPGQYGLEQTAEPRFFAWANGPQALRPLTFAGRDKLWTAERKADGSVEFAGESPQAEPVAVIGARACDLAALYIYDRHFMQGEHPDPWYTARRQKLFLIAVHCTHPSLNCFCASTGDGPRASYGYDLALSELDEGFLIEARSEKGERILAGLPVKKASAEQIETTDREIEDAGRRQVKGVPSRNLKDVLFARLDHPRWNEVAQRCLSCTNCTLVCPTCFCHSENDVPSLDGSRSEHYREWDSCFTQRHSYIHGITIRPDTRTRYRQWLTHKVGSWHDQFGRSGCVGCGRCITWCPVGIDITEELAAICR